MSVQQLSNRPGRVTGTGNLLFSVRIENLSSLTGVCSGACANIKLNTVP